MEKLTPQRNYLLDNLKGFAILLVIFGHFIQPCVKENDLIRGLFLGFYTFHMPLFCLVSGYLFKLGRSPIKNRVKKYSVYFIIGQVAYTAICWLLDVDLIYYSLLWYLVALTVWTIVTPLITRRGAMLPMMVALLGGLLIGFLPTESFTIVSPRIITYYPYFLMGVLLYEKRELPLQAKFSPRKRALLGATFPLLFGLLLSQLELINYRSVFLNQDYLDLEVTYLVGVLTRIGLYALGFTAALVLFYTFSKKASIFTSLGRISAVLYLVHGLVIKVLLVLWKDGMTNPSLNMLVTLGVMIALLAYSFRRLRFEKVPT